MSFHILPRRRDFRQNIFQTMDQTIHISIHRNFLSRCSNSNILSADNWSLLNGILFTEGTETVEYITNINKVIFVLYQV